MNVLRTNGLSRKWWSRFPISATCNQSSHFDHHFCTESKLNKVEEVYVNKNVLLRHLPEHPSRKQTTVFLLGWGDGKLQHLKKYSSLFESRGFNTILVKTKLVDSIIFPKTRVEPYMDNLLKDIKQHLPKVKDNPAILCIFSNGGGAAYFFLSRFLKNPNGSHYRYLDVKGTIFDSSPILPDLKSIVPSMIAFTQPLKNPILKLFVRASLSVIIPSVVLFNPVVKLYSKELHEDTWNNPQLFLYSKADLLTNTDYIRNFADHRQRRTGKVKQMFWEDSKHCEHLRTYPEQYEKLISEFLNDCELD